MNGTIRYRKVALLAGVFTSLSLASGGGAAKTSTAMIALTVTIVAPPCVINNNQAITVEFGDVMTTRVDGNNYRMPVNYTLSCPSGSPSAMRLSVEGTAASFSSSLLKTSNPALGIQLQTGTATFPVNFRLNFTYPNKPELWVLPVKQPGATLTGGEFTATATMKVDYQ